MNEDESTVPIKATTLALFTRVLILASVRVEDFPMVITDGVPDSIRAALAFEDALRCVDHVDETFPVATGSTEVDWDRDAFTQSWNNRGEQFKGRYAEAVLPSKMD